MKFIIIVDFQNIEHHVNIEYIVDITEFNNKGSNITSVDIRDKDGNTPLKTIKTRKPALMLRQELLSL